MFDLNKSKEYSQLSRKLLWLNVIPVVLIMVVISVLVIPQQVKYARNLMEQGDHVKAEEVLVKYIGDAANGEARQNNHFAYAYRAINRIELGNYQEALDDASRSVFFKWYFHFMNREIHISNPKYETCQELFGLLDIEKELIENAIRKICIVDQDGS